MPSVSPRPRAHSPRVWVWLLTLLLVALLVWVVGRRVEQRPHEEIGVTQRPPAVVVTPPEPAAEERASGGARSDEGSSGGGGGENVQPAVPVSPAPRR